GRMWQVGFSDLIKNTVNIPTITSGSITDLDQINTILLGGKADLVALGKPLLLDPYFVRRAQAYEYDNMSDLPQPYHKAIVKFTTSILDNRQQTESMKR